MATVENQIMELREKQAFWRGFASGIAGTVVALGGLIASGYYLIQIYIAVKGMP